MQFHLSRVWHRFAYTHMPTVQQVQLLRSMWPFQCANRNHNYSRKSRALGCLKFGITCSVFVLFLGGLPFWKQLSRWPDCSLQVIQPIIKLNRDSHSTGPLALPGPQFSNLMNDDAFGSILAWLFSKLPRMTTVGWKTAGTDTYALTLRRNDARRGVFKFLIWCDDVTLRNGYSHSLTHTAPNWHAKLSNESLSILEKICSLSGRLVIDHLLDE